MRHAEAPPRSPGLVVRVLQQDEFNNSVRFWRRAPRRKAPFRFSAPRSLTSAPSPSSRLPLARAQLRLLSGSNANLAQCVALAVISLCCCLGSVSVAIGDGMNGEASTTRTALIGFYLLAILLLSTSVLQAAKMVRDRRMADIFVGDMLSLQLKGTEASRVMTGINMAAAMALAIACVCVLGTAGDSAAGTSFLLLAIAFLLTSLTNLSKAWRDRFDALFFHDAARKFPERFAEISRGVHTLETTGGYFYTLNLAAAVISTASILAAIFVPAGNNLELSWKLLLAIAILFMISAAVNASKFVRDSMEEGAIKPTPQWRAIVILSVVISLAAVFGLEAVVCINSQVSSRLCALLYIGSFWVLGSVITLSKITRDRDEKSRSVIKAADLAAAAQRSARL